MTPPRINKVMFSGVLIADPDLRRTAPNRDYPDGVPVCNVTLAQPERKRIGGRWVDGDPIFVNVALWGPRAEEFARSHKRGDTAYIEGRLRFDVWDDCGRKRTKLKVNADEWQPVAACGDGGPVLVEPG